MLTENYNNVWYSNPSNLYRTNQKLSGVIRFCKGKPFRSCSDKAKKPKKKQNYNKTWWRQCQCSGSSQIPNQESLDDCHQFLSLYKIKWCNNRVELIIYDTETEKEEVKILDTEFRLDLYSNITQLPNGELFCDGAGVTSIIDRNYGVRMLPSRYCVFSSVLYFDDNIYCFGGMGTGYRLAQRFDLEKNRWTNLTSLPEHEIKCHSVIFNGNILISGMHCKNLWLYTIEIDSFSIIPYDFSQYEIKFLINAGRLYLIKGTYHGRIYESEDNYHLKVIARSEKFSPDIRFYWLYNKEKVYISVGDDYFMFDLKDVIRKIK